MLQNRTIVFIYGLLAFLLFCSCNAQPTKIINASPSTNLRVHTKQPVYYYVQHKLYYSANGQIKLDKPIWEGIVSERFYNNRVSVSLDSRYVLLFHESGLDVIDSVGHKIFAFKDSVKGRKKHRYESTWSEWFQWSADSKALYLKKRSADSASVDDATGSALVKMDLSNGNMTTVYNFTEPSWDFYLGTHDSFYYTAIDSLHDQWLLKKVDLRTKAVIPVFKDEERRLKTTDTICANLMFDNRLRNNQIYIGNRSYDDCNIYAKGKDKAEKLLFEVQCGTSSLDKSKHYHLQEWNTEVYVSGQYYFCGIYDEDYKTMIVDLNTLEYNFYPEYIKPYIASTIETENLIYIGTELRVSRKP